MEKQHEVEDTIEYNNKIEGWGMKINKIVLVLPNYYWCTSEFWHVHPINLCLLAGVLKDEYEVEIIDANLENLSEDELAERIRVSAPDLLGITSFANQFAPASHAVARIGKEVFPEMPVVMGGVYVTTTPEAAIKDTHVDYLVIGEGERTFLRLIKFLEGKEDFPAKGIGYRDSSGNPKLIRLTEYIEDLDSLPFPDYSKIDYPQYTTNSFKNVFDSPRAFPYARMITSRGCPNNCSFCAVHFINGRKTRFQSAERVLAEIDWLVTTYGIKAIEFNDDHLLQSRERIDKILKAMIARKYNIVWNAMDVMVRSLSEDLLELMWESGCRYISFPFESGNERVIKKIIGKPMDFEHGVRMVEKAKELGMDTTADFIIGNPGETYNEIMDTINFAESLDVDYVKINVATPYPNTRLFQDAVRLEAFPEGYQAEKMIWGSSRLQTEHFDPCAMAIVRAFEWDRINHKTEAKRKKLADRMLISVEQLDQIRKKTREEAIQFVSQYRSGTIQ